MYCMCRWGECCRGKEVYIYMKYIYLLDVHYILYCIHYVDIKGGLFTYMQYYVLYIYILFV
jgi:hypothetical protein